MSYLKILAVGGDTIPLLLEEKTNAFLEEHNCHCKMIIGYGMTELSATVCTSSPKVHKIGTVGIPLPRVVAKIIDPDSFKEKTYDQIGEVCISAPSMMKEYFNNCTETNNIIRYHNDEVYWIHTGDIGKIDKDGFLTIVGRTKRIITVIDNNGIYHKVYPQIIEDVLLQQGSILEVAVVGKPSGDKNNQIVAFAVCRSQTNETVMELRDFSQSRLEAWEQPCEYRIIENLPRTLIGKIDYRMLESIAAKED